MERKASLSGSGNSGSVAKGAVKEVQDQDDQFLSTMFVVKQSKKIRPIFNLKALNNYVETQKFKLESLDLVKTILKPNDYLMKLDLKDAHYSVPKHKSAGNTFDSNFKV